MHLLSGVSTLSEEQSQSGPVCPLQSTDGTPACQRDLNCDIVSSMKPPDVALVPSKAAPMLVVGGSSIRSAGPDLIPGR